MADRDFQILVDIAGDSQSLRNELKTGQQSVRDFNTELGAMNRALLGATGGIRSVRDSARSLATDLGIAERATESLVTHTRGLRDAMIEEAAASGRATRALNDKADASKVSADAQRSFARTILDSVLPALGREADMAKGTGAALSLMAREASGASDDQGKLAAKAAEAAAALNTEKDAARGAAGALGEKADESIRAADAQEQVWLNAIKTSVAMEREAQSTRGASRALAENAAAARLAASQNAEAARKQGEAAASQLALSRLLWHKGGAAPIPWVGGAIGGLGGFSAATMLGLGSEHLIGAGLSIVGSAAGALGGAATVGAGALGTTAVGGGSDMAVMKSTIADTKTLYTNYTALQTAVSQYGASSQQAATAQSNLNQSMKDLGPGAKFELALAKQVSQLNTMWDKQSGTARQRATQILGQVAGLAKDFMPLVIQAAERNLQIINHDIRPLFQWLEGPQGMGIWKDLENHFAHNLPTAIDAFTQGVEVLLRYVDLAAKYSGRFLTSLDLLFRRLNSHSDFWFEEKIRKMMTDLHLWESIIKNAARDLSALFHMGVGEGNGVLQIFDKWLIKIGEWERSVKGQTFLRDFFRNRGNELRAILELIPPIAKAFGTLYASVQPLVPVVTFIFGTIGNVLRGLEQMSPGFTMLLGAFVVTGKILGFSNLLGAIGLKFGLITKGASEATVATDRLSVAIERMSVAQAGSGVAAISAGALGAGTGLGGAAAIGAEGAVSRSAAAGEMAGLGSAVTSTFEGGMIGGMMKGADKVGGVVSKMGPMLKLGLGIWVGSGIISGVETAVNSSGDLGTKIGNGIKGTLSSIIGKSLTNSAFGFALPGFNGLGPSMDMAKKAVQGLQTVMSADKWSTVNNAIDGLKLHSYEAGGAIAQAFRGAAGALQSFENKVINFGAVTPAMASKVIASFQGIKNQGGSAMNNMAQTVAMNMAMIKADVGTGSKQAKDDLALNFKTAADYMAANYRAMGISTQNAMKFINTMLLNALKELGVNPPKSLKLSNTQERQLLNTVTGGVGSPGSLPSLSQNAPGLAQGGILGNPNAAGADKYHVIVGEGEAIITRHQRNFIDSQLPGGMNVKGVVGSIRTPNYAARGFAPGGGSEVALPLPLNQMMPSRWSIDQGVDIPAPAHTPEYAMGPGTIIQEGISGFGPNAPVLHVTGGPLAGRNIYYGHAGPDLVRTGAHVTAGEQISEVGAGIVGMSSGPHIEIGFGPPFGSGTAMAAELRSLMSGHGGALAAQLGGAGVAGGLAGGMFAQAAPNIPNSRVKGLGTGILDKIAQAAVNKYHNAAQSYVNNAVGANGSGAPIGNMVGDIMSLAQKAALLEHVPWNAGIVRTLLSSESSGGQNLPPTGSLHATGPFQVTPPTFGQYHAPGHGNITAPWDNSLAAMNYIAHRYHTLQNLAAVTGLGTSRYVGYSQGGIVDPIDFMAATGIDFSAAVRKGTPNHAGGNRTSGTSSRSTKAKAVSTHPKVRKPGVLKGVKKIPGLPGILDGFTYYYDDHAIKADVHTGSSKYINYPGGNSAALARATGSDWEYLLGILGLVTDTDPTTNAPLTGAAYAYGANNFYKGDPANPGGYIGAWKLDQEIAAQLGILSMEQGEYAGAGREQKRLGKWVGTADKRLGTIAGRASIENQDILDWRKYLSYLSVKKSHTNFAGERLGVEKWYSTALSRLAVRGLTGRYSLTTLYNDARTQLTREQNSELGAIPVNLNRQTAAAERANIRNEFGSRLNSLSNLRAKASMRDQIGITEARNFLHLAELDRMYAIGRKEQGYTGQRAQVQSLITTTGQHYTTDRRNASIIARDLMAASSGSITGKTQKALLSMGIDASVLPVSFSGSSGEGDMKTEIANRINQLFDDVRTTKNVTIPQLEQNRNSISGSTAAGAASTVDNSLALSLAVQSAANAAADNAVLAAQLKTLQGFTPLLGQMVGSFAGGGVIPQTGYALVHRDETITPDPQGPFGSSISGSSHGSGGKPAPIELTVVLSGPLAPLSQFIDARIQSSAQRTVSQQTGFRTRVIGGNAGH